MIVTAEAELAFAIRCPLCGVEWFVKAVPPDATDLAAIADEIEEQSVDPAEWLTRPDHVDCPKCQTQITLLCPDEELE